MTTGILKASQNLTNRMAFSAALQSMHLPKTWRLLIGHYPCSMSAEAGKPTDHARVQFFYFKENPAVDDASDSVVITRRACIRSHTSVVSNVKFQVGENCDRCMTCIRDLECPAISFIKTEKIVRIDPDSCSGCGFCVDACPSQAISVWRNVK